MSYLENESPGVFINNISCEVPSHEVHREFIAQAPGLFLKNDRDRRIFARLAKKNQVERRYSVLSPEGSIDGRRLGTFFDIESFPGTEERMRVYREAALPLVRATVNDLAQKEDLSSVTHLFVTSCTGFYAPGIDLEIMEMLGLGENTQRSLIGFMGCQAAFNALRLAQQAVRSDQRSRVLMVNVELCTLHLKNRHDLEGIVPYMIFADGCSASLMSAQPRGLKIEGFHSFVSRRESSSIRWNIGDQGFDMHLSIDLPTQLEKFLAARGSELSQQRKVNQHDLIAIHPGGRGILDAAQKGLDLLPEQLSASREILREFGNMSSPTIMFVLKKQLQQTNQFGHGFAVGFGPGLSAETMTFTKPPL